MDLAGSLEHALWMAFVMFWDIFWGLNLGFLFSALIDALVSKNEMSRLLPDSKPRRLLTACVLGAASFVHTPRSPWPGRWFAKARISPRQWLSSSPPPTWCSS
jgi:hypothetical protein